MSERQFAPAAYNAVKTGTKMLVQDLGGVDAAATVTRVGRSQLSAYTMLTDERFIPADVVMDLEFAAGTPRVTAALARAQGYGLVPVEPMREKSALAVLLSRIGKDVGELFATSSTALSHPALTEAERADLIRELDDLRRAAAETIFYLKESP
jgi:hypothetical protein